MLFVAARARRLPLVAVAVVLLHVAVAWAAVEAFGLEGAALALAVTTGLVLAVLLAELSPRVLAASGRALLAGAALTAAAALVAFGAPAALLPNAAAAVLGTAVFAAALLAARNLGLRDAWGYLRTLD